MTEDTGALGRLAAAVMEDLEAKFGDEAWIRTVMIVYEVDMGDRTVIDAASSDDRVWVQEKFLDEACWLLEERRRAVEERDE